MSRSDHLDDPALQRTADLLRAHRHEATPLELDALKRRIRRAAGRPARSAPVMKSRLAVLCTLVLGMMLSTTGAGLAISGVTSSNDASVAQYGHDHGRHGNGNTLGDHGSGTAPATHHASNSGTGPADVAQPVRQVETGSGSGNLPFTGYLAIPVLLGGVALLGTGMVLRRRLGDDRT